MLKILAVVTYLNSEGEVYEKTLKQSDTIGKKRATQIESWQLLNKRYNSKREKVDIGNTYN